MKKPLPRLWAITQRLLLEGLPLSSWLRAVARAGVDGVQLREKDPGDRVVLDLAAEARRILPSSTCLAINRRADIAVAADADGVHLPSSGVPTEQVVRVFGDRLLVGRSTHSVDEVEEAKRAGADYVVFGPVYPTPGKPGSVGLEELGRATAVGIPVYALGGVGQEQLPEVAAAGALGAAGIRLFLDTAALPDVVACARACFPRPAASLARGGERA